MKKPRDLARRFLALADRDIKAFQRLADSTEIDDAAVGFHAQQAVEKCLKAVLALHAEDCGCGAALGRGSSSKRSLIP